MVLFWFKIKMSVGKSEKDNGKMGNGKVGFGILEFIDPIKKLIYSLSMK
jgi:hypothetical protein